VLTFSSIVCVAPLWLGGLRGRKSTPSIGWKVPVRSHGSASWSWTKRERETITSGSSHLAMVRMCIICIKYYLNFLFMHFFIVESSLE
jgi:hypothetical protein